MSDPRRKRAEQVRNDVILTLSNSDKGLRFSELLAKVRNRAVARNVDDREVDRALQVLRRDGRIRYERQRWEVVR